MDEGDVGSGAPTRREYLTYAGVAAGSGLLAGCTGETADDDSSGSDTGSSNESYTVEMAPVGELEFESPPERWSTYFPGYADMGVALGRGDGLTAVEMPSRYHTHFYDELDGVSMDTDDLTAIYNDGVDKELFYELDNDVHLTDPQWYRNDGAFSFDREDIDEIEDQVAPFFGNLIFRRTDSWHDHRYYTMYEAFEKVAEVFQERERFEAFQSLHDEFLADVQASLPPADDRPAGLLAWVGADEPEEFHPSRLTDKGTNKKHFRDLGVSDSLVGTGIQGLSTSERGTIDYETILEVDPELLFLRGHEGKTREEFADTVLAFMKEHSVAGDLTAVQNDDVYRGGPIYQGPIQNLFLTERYATLLYPDAYEDELFDRDRVAEIVAGEV